MNELAKELTRLSSLEHTENGALQYSASVLDPLLRIMYNVRNFRASVKNMRNNTEHYADFMIRYSLVNDDKIASEIKNNLDNPEFIKNLYRLSYFLRDPRSGMGERAAGRSILFLLMKNGVRFDANKLYKHLYEFGRIDDYLILAECFNNEAMIDVVETWFYDDINCLIDREKLNVSLLGKWMPSINTSSKVSRLSGKFWAQHLKLSEREYRKTLRALRNRIDIVEHYITKKNYGKIDYSKVPSQAMRRYAESFQSYDSVRYSAYLESVKNGTSKMNIGTLTPPELVERLSGSTDMCNVAFEELIKKYNEDCASGKIKPLSNILPICDMSGSMSGEPMNISTGIGAYFARINRGSWKNLFMTFAGNPSIVKIDDNMKLSDIVVKMRDSQKDCNTNMEAVLELLLNTAIRMNAKSDDIPALLIISDMQFDETQDYCYNLEASTVFEQAKVKFNNHGFVFPRVIFWNARDNSGVPMMENELGVTLLSGSSTNLIDMVMSGELDPYKNLYKKLEQYNMVDNDIL